MKPLIVIPVYNDLKYFKIAVDSLINSTDYPFMLIIIESESTDGSAEYADSLKTLYPSTEIEIIHTKKEGPMKAMNLGFKLALERKRDLYFTQTDAQHFRLCDRDWLMEYVLLSEVNDCGMITCHGGGGISGPNYVQGFNWVGGWSTYIPYKTIEKFGGYDENFKIGWGADIEYSWRMVANGLRIYRIDYWVNHHRHTAHTNDKNPLIGNIDAENALYFQTKYGFPAIK